MLSKKQVELYEKAIVDSAPPVVLATAMRNYATPCNIAGFNYCCGAVEVGNFRHSASTSPLDLAKFAISMHGRLKGAAVLVATTISSQTTAIKLLKAAGFTPTVAGRNPNSSHSITFWYLTKTETALQPDEEVKELAVPKKRTSAVKK